MKSVLVTGGTGFCGSYACEFFKQQGFSVIGTSYDVQNSTKLEGIQYRHLDIRSSENVQELIQDSKPDFLVHLAAQSIPAVSWKKPEETEDVNVQGTRYFLEALLQHSPQTKMVFASTNQVYGRTFLKEPKVIETSAIDPENPYAESKARGEEICREYADDKGLSVIIARPFNHFGARQADRLVFSSWCQQIAEIEQGRQNPVLSVGNVALERNFLHVLDVVDAYWVLLQKGVAGEAYNICADQSILLKDCLEYLLKKATCKIEFQEDPEKIRSFDPPQIAGDASKLKNLGWSTKHTIFEALDELLADWRARVNVA